MKEVMDFVMSGVFALILAFVTSPILLEFYGDAVQAIENTTAVDQSTQDLLKAVFVLILITFYLAIGYALYAVVQQKFDM